MINNMLGDYTALNGLLFFFPQFIIFAKVSMKISELRVVMSSSTKIGALSCHVKHAQGCQINDVLGCAARHSKVEIRRLYGLGIPNIKQYCRA